MLLRCAFMVMFGVILLVCIANRSWLVAEAHDALYGDRRGIHIGKDFRPGATAVEDGVLETAVLIGRTPRIRVRSPSARWLRHHRDAVCERGVCTAAATRMTSRRVDLRLGAVLAGLLAGFIVWTLLTDDRRH